MYLWRKVEILQGQDEKEAEMEVIVNFLHILGLKNIYWDRVETDNFEAQW